MIPTTIVANPSVELRAMTGGRLEACRIAGFQPAGFVAAPLVFPSFHSRS